jgi:hypothetical protein
MAYDIIRCTRQNRWVQEYQTTRGKYVDSKYRTGLCDTMSLEFIKAWSAAEADEQADMIVCLRFFPWFRGGEFDRIATFLGSVDSGIERSIRLSWLGVDGELTVEEADFISALTRWILLTGAQRRLIGTNPWFRVFHDEGGLSFEPSERALGQIGAGEWERLIFDAGNTYYGEAIKLLRASPFLLSRRS